MPVAVPITMPSTSPIAQPVRQCSVAVAAIAQVAFMPAHYTPMGYIRLCVAGLGSETGDSGRADQAISAIMTIESVLTTACEITAGQIEPERSRIQACTTPTTKAKRTSGGQTWASPKTVALTSPASRCGCPLRRCWCAPSYWPPRSR